MFFDHDEIKLEVNNRKTKWTFPNTWKLNNTLPHNPLIKEKLCCLVTKLCLTLRFHGMQHTRLPCPSLSSGVCSSSCLLSQWCHLTISSCFPFLLLPSIFPSIRVFSNDLALCIMWPKLWSFSFSINSSNEYSELISSRIDWLDLLAVQGLSRVFSSTTDQKHPFFLGKLKKELLRTRWK